MKHLPKILFLALLCIACRDEHDVPTHDFTIGFKAGVENTRAVVTDTEPLKDGFSVWGGFDGTTVFDGRKVYWGTDSEGNTGWMYDNPEVWVLDQEYHFFAVYPLQEANNVTLSDNNLSYRLAYVMPATADLDLLTASKTVNTNDIPPATVALNFTHALTRININLKKAGANAEEQVVIHALSIKNLKQSGTFKGTFNSDSTKWEDCVDGMNYTSSGNLDKEVDEEENTSIISDLLFIPQIVIANSIQLSITYSIKSGSSVDYFTAETFIPKTVWEKGKSYTYNIILGAANNHILFGIPEVSDWEREENVGGSVIIQ